MQRMNSKQLNARLDGALMDRLDRRSRAVGENRSRLAERLIDEGLRMAELPGIVFRDGPSGRRVSLVDGPDVWEVIGDLRAAVARSSANPVAAVARRSSLGEGQVRLAAAYYDAYPEEIDARIAQADDLAAATEAALRRLASA
jgi:hypothetical protein